MTKKIPLHYHGGKLYHAILNNRDLLVGDKFLLAIIASYMNFYDVHNSNLVIKISTLCKKSSMKKDSVIEKLNFLSENGYITIQDTEYSNECYSFKVNSLIFDEYKEEGFGDE